jgi:hypothetical protein
MLRTALRPLQRATRLAGVRTSSSAAFPYTPAPTFFGIYDVLDPSTALEAYPEPLPVPESIARPAYVPANFFTAPIWEHSEPGEQPDPERIVLGSDGHVRAKKAGELAAKVLKEVGKMVKVSGRKERGWRWRMELISAWDNDLRARQSRPPPHRRGRRVPFSIGLLALPAEYHHEREQRHCARDTG